MALLQAGTWETCSRDAKGALMQAPLQESEYRSAAQVERQAIDELDSRLADNL